MNCPIDPNTLEISGTKRIEEIVERTSMSYLDAMLYHADENGLESETVAGLINVKTKNKLREEAEKLNFMPKTSKLPI